MDNIRSKSARLAHPSGRLQSTWVELLRQEADKATAKGQLTAKQLRLFYEQGWFKALVPQKYGGLQWSLSEVVRFEEAIGWAEGSAGWVFTLCSGAGWFGGYLDPGLAARIFKPKKACLAGSGAIGGRGKLDHKGQLIVSGRWKYATGAPHGTIFTANVYLEAEQKIRSFLLLPEEIKIEKRWNPIGLIASASESFSCSKIIMPPERAFDIQPDNPQIHAPLYRLPFGPLAEATIAANLSGMCLHFMEEVKKLWSQKHRAAQTAKSQQAPESDPANDIEALLEYYTAKWQRVRSLLWVAVEKLESFVNEHMAEAQLSVNPVYVRKAAAVSAAAQRQAALCRKIVNGLYPYTGLNGANGDTAVGKVWRDFQTGSQHALFMPATKLPK